jgi:glycosyltransferase involved in cell wall biosynthesis
VHSFETRSATVGKLQLKVVQVHNYYRSRGGECNVFDRMIAMLRRRGNDVFPLTRCSNDIGHSFWNRIRALVSSLYSISAANTIAALIRDVNPDVVHIHNLYPLISPSVLVVCRKARVPVVMTCHNYRLTCPIALNFRAGRICYRCRFGREFWCLLKNCRGDIVESLAFALRNFLARKGRFFLDNVTVFVALNSFQKRWLVESGFPSSRVCVLPHMVSFEHTGSRDSNGQYIAYAGRISAEKGIKVLIEAMRLTPEYLLRIAGDYSGMPELLSSAPPNVQFMGQLNSIQLSKFYQEARFLVVPSICLEPFPLVVGEAMSFGLPIIASRLGGLPEMIHDGVNGLLFEPGNAEDLAKKMKVLWGSPALCREMGQVAREITISRYGEEEYYWNLMVVYEKSMALNKKCTE